MANFNSFVNVKTPRSSGKNMSHSCAYTGKCGTLYPVLVDSLIPGDIINLRHILECQLPPMATDFFGRISMNFEAFFVPNRLLYGGWQRFIEQVPGNAAYGGKGQTSGNVIFQNDPVVLPQFQPVKVHADKNSLADFLGNKSTRLTRQPLDTVISLKPMSVLPFVAYHKIFDDHYRNSNITAPVFVPYSSNSVNYEVASLPYRQYTSTQIFPDNQYLADGVALYSLRQRNFAKDYFTNATITPFSAADQTGLGDVAVSDGKFTIADLRAANSLQLFAERNNLAGVDYLNVIKANFGVTPTHVNTKSIYLGRHRVPVYIKGVSQTASLGDTTSSNPFNSVAAKYGQPTAYDEGSLVDNFRVTEHGFLFVIASLVPERLYSSGTRRYLYYDDISDFGFPLLENVGDQPIYKWEVGRNVDDPTKNEGYNFVEDVFGYTQRYSEYKYYPDEVHGEFSDGQSLHSFVLQTSVSGSNASPFGGINSDFIYIPQDYLKQVKAYQDFTTSDPWSFDFQACSYFNYKKVSKLSDYSIPSLTNPNLTDKTTISKSGNFL